MNDQPPKPPASPTMLDQITPILLTYNEEPNIARTLNYLRWARDIVVVDSYSTDGTLEQLKACPQVRVFQRKFDSHAGQWNYAVSETGIVSPWVLAMDADYQVTAEAAAEIARLDPDGPVDGYTASFTYCIWGRPLRGTLYPPVTVLYRRAKGNFYQDGHTHRLRLDGTSRALASRLLHDDRKPLTHWLMAQDRYMRLEATHVLDRPWSELGIADRVRRYPLLAPFAVFANCYLLKGGFRDGWAGLYYSLQRMLAEALLGLRIIETRMARQAELKT